VDHRDEPLLSDESTRWPPGIDHLAIEHSASDLDDEAKEDDEVASCRELVGYRSFGHRFLSDLSDASVSSPGR
jgi:hypothetical protein